MQQRTLGTQGLAVSAVGYGSMGTAVGYGPTDDAESIAAIRHAHDLGVTLFDTAEMYGWGGGEKLLGRAVAPFREEVMIATKFGLTREFGTDSRPEHIRAVVEASLRNLDVDCVDVLYQHRVDPAVPIEDVVGTMAEFVEAGTVRYLGLSEAPPETIRKAHAVHPISVLQTEYSIFAPDAAPLFPLLEELGIGFVAYSPLARGFLTGTAKPAGEYGPADFRRRMPWWAADNFDANALLVAQFAAIADAKGVTLPQLALAWALAARDYVVPIPGSRNTDRVAANIAAADVALTPDELARVAAIAPDGGRGGRGTPSPWL
ncbi:aldo/keto reductase [Tomitella fengzijianii]|uniref:Aldo/keto reductase n=1 Tax=Tomitella fengzijianii TaxID=2597660 RepID=A0A516X6W0_9ACTN|nr:aldo/keto reductase [Tomitella fengzijianii]QDQ98790.1 aldo/keto reductase [Tomitella fengzijianii]